MMFSEARFGVILFAPIVGYCLIGAVIFALVRLILARSGVMSWVWHPSLFEFALLLIITSSITLLFA